MLLKDKELKEAFKNDELVVVCCHPGCDLHRLRHWRKGVWFQYDKKDFYQPYSHSYCTTHLLVLQKDIEEHFATAAL